MGNGSKRHGDAKADRLRDEMAKLDAERRERLDSLADADWGPLATGKFAASEATTKSDKPLPVSHKLKPIEQLVAVANTWPKVVALALVLIAVVVLIIWGPGWIRQALG